MKRTKHGQWLWLPVLLLGALPAPAQSNTLPDGPRPQLGLTSEDQTVPTTDKTASPDPTSVDPQTTYHKPNGRMRFRRYVLSTVGPVAILRSAANAAIQQGRDIPGEWGDDAEGYGQRFASSMGQNAISRTAQFVLSTALREDDRYFPCINCGFGQKVKTAFLAQFTARRGEDGHAVFSISKVVSPFVGGIAAQKLWYPGDPAAKEGARQAGLSIGLHFATNLVRELVRR